MTKPTAGLVGTMVGGRVAHSARNHQRRERLRALQKSNRLIDRARALFRADFGAPGNTNTLPFILFRTSWRKWHRARDFAAPDSSRESRRGPSALVVFFGREGGQESESWKGAARESESVAL